MTVGGTMKQSVESTTDSLKSLSLSVTAGNTTKYSFICLFLTRLLNLKDPKTILNDNGNLPHKRKRPVELLPGIAIPQDIWLYHEIIIKNIKIKTSLIHEFNTMLEKYLLPSGFTLEQASILYYQKLLTAYKFLEMPKREPFYDNYNTEDLDLSFKEEDLDLSFKEEDEDEMLEDSFDSESKALDRTDSNETFDASHESATIDSRSSSTSISPNTSFSTTSSTVLSSKRVSSLSKDLMSRKRFLSLLGHKKAGTETRAVSEPMLTSQGTNSPDEEPKRQQALNSLLAKSRIYNKIKKHRELSGSINSGASSHSSFSYSNRNSISTTGTTVSSRRRGSALAYEINDKSSVKTASSIPFPKLNIHQIYSNRKLKYEYYLELQTLNKRTNELVSLLTTNLSHSIIELLEFLQHNALKLVVIDFSQMLVDYAYFKSHYLYAV